MSTNSTKIQVKMQKFSFVTNKKNKKQRRKMKKKINAFQDHCGLVIDVYSLRPIKQTLGIIGLGVFRFLCVSGRNWQWLSLKNKNVATMLLPELV